MENNDYHDELAAAIFSEHQAKEEMHQLTIETLKKAVGTWTDDELSLMCYLCGVNVEDVK